MMQLTHAEQTFESLKPQVEGIMRKTLDEAVGGKQLNPEQRAAYERGREQMVAAISTRYNWDAIRDM